MATQRRTTNHATRAFTLIEMMIVILIILAVSVVALPTVLSASKDRAVGDAARTLHAAIYGARDAAQNTGVPHGLRFVPDTGIGVTIDPATNQLDPKKALVSDHWIQTEIPPDYQNGLVSVWPGTDYTSLTALPCLVLEEQPGHWEGSTWTLNEPANWWNVIRLGERVELRGQRFTVCGPMQNFSPEMFTNANPPTPYSRVYTAPDGTQVTAQPQYLFLVNGKDDNNDGFVDNGWDGIDNDAANGIDDAGEWEIESWPSSLAGGVQGSPYVIVRRPVPSPGQQATALPGTVVIDLTTWQTTGERSHMPVNPYTGQVDLLINPDGSMRADTPYSGRSSVGMASSFYHWWLGDRGDIRDPVVTQGSFLTLPIPPALAGSRHLVQVQTQSGRTRTGPLEHFAPLVDPQTGVVIVPLNSPAAPMVPFLEYRQGN